MSSESLPNPAERSRIEQYLDMMVYIIRADGKVEPEEREHLLALMAGMQLDPALVSRYQSMLEADFYDPVSDSQLREVVVGLDPDSLAHLIIDSYKLAFSDGTVQEEEKMVIQRCLAVAGIPADRYETIDSWARHTIELAQMGAELFHPPA